MLHLRKCVNAEHLKRLMMVTTYSDVQVTFLMLVQRSFWNYYQMSREDVQTMIYDEIFVRWTLMKTQQC